MKHELLSPAGNLEAGYAALHYGADAVYLGLTKFSARAGAINFTAEELDEFTAYAHSLNRKVFVALNTVLTEAETKELEETFDVIRRTQVDALIIQDLGVFYLAKRLLPEVELHASTQMAVHNAEGAKFLQSIGFKRVVLARELSLREIKEIAKATPGLDLEVFVHGALCYSYSGQCLFSALEYGKSANRGRCVYPCRNIFCKEDGTHTHLFSMKDLALEEGVLDIPALSLKIEGRKKSPLYVAAVTNYYRHILDGKKKDLHEAEDIKQIFSRPWCQFHFNGKNKDITDENFVGHRGLLIGKVERVGKGRLGFKTTHTLARYDGIQIDVLGDEKPFGFGIKNLFVNNKPVFEANKGQYVDIELPEDRPHLEVGSPVYLASSSAVKGKYDYTKPKSGIFRNQIPFDVTIEVNKKEVWAMSGATTVSIIGQFEQAKDIQKVNEAILSAFTKTGGTPFKLAELEIKNPMNLFIPVSMLNDLRRRLLDSLAENMPQATYSEENRGDDTVIPSKPQSPQNIKLHKVSFDTDASKISKGELQESWFVLPQICRNMERLKNIIKDLYAHGVRKFMAENYYAFEILKPYKDIKIGAGSFIYVMNSYATRALKEFGVEFATLALESSADNMQDVVAKAVVPMAQVIKAYPPLFTSAVCIRPNSCKECKQGLKQYKLKKDGKEYIAVSKDCQIQLFSQKAYERERIASVSYFI